MTRLANLLATAAAAAIVVIPLCADPIGFTIPPPNTPDVQASTYVLYSSDGFAQFATCGSNPIQTCSADSPENEGITHASASLPFAGFGTDSRGEALQLPPAGVPYVGPIVYGSTAVTATEGHVTADILAHADDLGMVESSADGEWYDTLTVTSGSLGPGSLVELVAHLTVDANIAGQGAGSGHAHASFLGGGDGAYGFDAYATKDVDPGYTDDESSATAEFTAFVGEQIPLQGELEVIADADGYQTPQIFQPSCTGCATAQAQWSVEASNSAHFSITPLDPNADITLASASGCDLSNGYGCDPLPSSETPEPGTLWLLGSGLLAAAWLLRRRAALSLEGQGD